MRTGLSALLVCVCLLSIAQMQAPPPPHMVAPSEGDGGVRDTVEGIVIPPIPNVPFTAMLSTEVTRYGADGSSMTGVNQRRIARDRRGRVYQERWYIVPKGGKIKSTIELDSDRRSQGAHTLQLQYGSPGLRSAGLRP